MMDVENLLSENQRVISFRTVPKGMGNTLAEVRKNVAYQNGPSDTVASESSPEPARGQLKPLLPFALRGEARYRYFPRNLTAGT